MNAPSAAHERAMAAHGRSAEFWDEQGKPDKAKHERELAEPDRERRRVRAPAGPSTSRRSAATRPAAPPRWRTTRASLREAGHRKSPDGAGIGALLLSPARSIRGGRAASAA